MNEIAPLRRVTIIDIAKAAGVSPSTVSLVLQKNERISAETRNRVEEAIRKLGYKYNRSAANLRRQTSQAIGLIINDICNPFFAEMTAGVQKGLEGTEFLVFLVETGDEIERQSRVYQSLEEHGIGGLIIFPASQTKPEFLERIAAGGTPICVAIRRPPDADVDYVGPDNRLAGRIATRHLIELGHRRIAFLGGEAKSPSRIDRVAGYQEALQRAGNAFDPALCVESRPTRANAISDLNKVLDLPEPPTAAIGYNDNVAIALMHGLRRRGLEPGRQFAIVGIDGTSEAELAYPALTTVALHAHETGRRAAELVLERIKAPGKTHENVILRPNLIVRASCGTR
ncbi:LacI family DNA-binding transcriptional regulator [Ancylobacter sp. FA202]|uniref:LacI family DNA-binding transcriptional regulator n=1 Tax=Ancylobacter sp. FA202 TaxID=1111106 RepID=UPI0003649760|nr:LacI family DNA-binding transcriptional regulator [Ancylobacter sp. FA202]